MWLIKAILWILKLFLRIILFPIFIAFKTLTMMLNLLLYLGAAAIGLFVLLMTYGVISQLLAHQWVQVALVFGMTAAAVGVFFGAGVIVAMLESASDCLGNFIFG